MFITIEVDDSNWTDLQRKQPIDYLLADALYEFQSHRRDPYAGKYADIYPDPAQVERKREQILARRAIAEDIRHGVLTKMTVS